MASYAGLRSHPFPTCFSCGTGRADGDGLRIFPGRVADQTGAARVAATWTPDPSVADDSHAYADGHPRAASRSPGPRSTASAAGPATSRSG